MEMSMKDKVISFVEELGWAYTANGWIIKVDVNNGDLNWSSFFKTDDNSSLTYFGVLPVRIPDDKLTLIAKLVNVVNSSIWFGNFELIIEGTERGQLRFRTSGFIPETADDETVDTLIRSISSYNMAGMSTYSKAFMKALYSDSDDIENFIDDTSNASEESDSE